MMSSLTHQAKCYLSLRPPLPVTEALLKSFPKMKTLIEKIKIPYLYIIYIFLLRAMILKFVIKLAYMAAHPTKLGLSTLHNTVANHINHISE